MYEGDEFYIIKAFARMNSIVFVTLMFAPGIPILYPIGMVWCLFTYITQKYMILFFYKRELKLKKEFADLSVNCLLITVIVHIIMSLLML